MNVDLSGKVADAWGEVISWIPEIIGALIVLFIGYVIAKFFQGLITGALNRININKKIKERPEGNYLKRITDNPSGMIGVIVYWLIWFLALTIALQILNIPVISQLIYNFYSYLPNILASIIILIVAIAVSAGLDALILGLMGKTMTGKILAAAAPSLILTIATFMVLVQLKIATPIIVITYAGIWGAIALGFALAFGLGGKDVASRLIEAAYNKGKENFDQTKRDIHTGAEHAKEEIEKRR